MALLQLPVARADGAADVAVCRIGTVEWIVGGVAESRCAAAARPASRAEPSPAAAAARVSAAEQRARDTDRQRILTDELRRQEALVASLRRKETGDPAALVRATEDLAALRREIERTSGERVAASR